MGTVKQEVEKGKDVDLIPSPLDSFMAVVIGQLFGFLSIHC